MKNAGTLKNEGGQLTVKGYKNQSNGKTENIFDYLAEAIVIAKGNVPFESITYQQGFVVSEGFENAGYLYPGGKGRPGYFPITGAFTQTASGIIDLEIGGKTNATETPAEYDQLAGMGTGTLDGNLLVRFMNDFEQSIQPADSFTVVKATTLTGTFSNAPDGGRLYTADDTGSFQVTYSETEVTLSDFQTELGDDAPAVPALTIAKVNGSEAIDLTITGKPDESYFLEESSEFIGWDIIAEVQLNEAGLATHQEPLGEEKTERFFRTRIK